MLDEVPHFSTFGKNYTRRFKDTDLFEQIFSHILEECVKHYLVDTSVIFADATHVKACANGKKSLKDKDDHNDTPPSVVGGNSSNEEDAIPEDIKTQKCSTTAPDSGWFRKGEHKHVFAYGLKLLVINMEGF